MTHSSMQGICTHVTDVKPQIIVATYTDAETGYEVYQHVTGTISSSRTGWCQTIVCAALSWVKLHDVHGLESCAEQYPVTVDRGVMTRPAVQSIGQHPKGLAAQYWRKRTAHIGDSGQSIHKVSRTEDARACH